MYIPRIIFSLEGNLTTSPDECTLIFNYGCKCPSLKVSVFMYSGTRDEISFCRYLFTASHAVLFQKNLIDLLVKIFMNYIKVIFQKSLFDMYKPIVDFITGTWQVACRHTL